MSTAGDARESERELMRLGSSYRQTTPEATWAEAAGLMRACGISRVTDITPLDRLGLPVFASVRPRGRALRVHAGKGILPSEARIGALMEAIEFSVAEPDRSAWTMHRRTAGELVEHFGRAFRFVDLAPRFGRDIEAAQVVQAVECDDLHTGRSMLLPAELVFVPFELDAAESLFGWSTDGLASGNSCAEATLHGLFEVLERDALTMDRGDSQSQWVDPAELPGTFAEVARRWRSVGVSLTVRHIPNEFGLPCFEAYLDEAESDVDLASGSGLHVDRDIALARAICEAAQSRLTTIQGTREDVTRFYAARQSTKGKRHHAARRKVVKRIESRVSATAYQAIEHDPSAGRSVDDVLRSVLARLAARGFNAVLRHRFAVDLGRLQVVKVIVPGCESVDHGGYRVGPRLMARIAAHA